MIKWNELTNKKWVVAVSGGADSMALLDMCVKHKINIVAAHVNYKKRDSADRDMLGVQKYCHQHQIPCFVHTVTKYETHYNFQAQAREIRYRFFKEIYEQQKADGVLVAHHLDDVIETYFMQVQRGSIPTWYGIAEEMYMYQILIKRILLDYTKKELEEYCEQHRVTYYHDESNFENHYTRNKIRHQQIDFMDKDEKKKIKLEIDKKNQSLYLLKKKVNDIVEQFDEKIEVAAFKEISEKYQKYVLREWIISNSSIMEISDKNLTVLIEMIVHKQGNFRHNINEYYFLLVEYGRISIYENKNEDYAYVYENVVFEKTFYFTVAKQGKKIEGITLYEDDYPITIRNARKGDKIHLKIGTKRVSRFFIDNKISHNERKSWPVVVNCKGNVIFVHKIGCDIKHYSNNSTIFVLK